MIKSFKIPENIKKHRAEPVRIEFKINYLSTSTIFMEFASFLTEILMLMSICFVCFVVFWVIISKSSPNKKDIENHISPFFYDKIVGFFEFIFSWNYFFTSSFSLNATMALAQTLITMLLIFIVTFFTLFFLYNIFSILIEFPMQNIKNQLECALFFKNLTMEELTIENLSFLHNLSFNNLNKSIGLFFALLVSIVIKRELKTSLIIVFCAFIYSLLYFLLQELKVKLACRNTISFYFQIINSVLFFGLLAFIFFFFIPLVSQDNNSSDFDLKLKELKNIFTDFNQFFRQNLNGIPNFQYDSNKLNEEFCNLPGNVLKAKEDMENKPGFRVETNLTSDHTSTYFLTKTSHYEKESKEIIKTLEYFKDKNLDLKVIRVTYEDNKAKKIITNLPSYMAKKQYPDSITTSLHEAIKKIGFLNGSEDTLTADNFNKFKGILNEFAKNYKISWSIDMINNEVFKDYVERNFTKFLYISFFLKTGSIFLPFLFTLVIVFMVEKVFLNLFFNSFDINKTYECFMDVKKWKASQFTLEKNKELIELPLSIQEISFNTKVAFQSLSGHTITTQEALQFDGKFNFKSHKIFNLSGSGKTTILNTIKNNANTLGTGVFAKYEGEKMFLSNEDLKHNNIILFPQNVLLPGFLSLHQMLNFINPNFKEVLFESMRFLNLSPEENFEKSFGVMSGGEIKRSALVLLGAFLMEKIGALNLKYNKDFITCNQFMLFLLDNALVSLNYKNRKKAMEFLQNLLPKLEKHFVSSFHNQFNKIIFNEQSVEPKSFFTKPKCSINGILANSTYDSEILPEMEEIIIEKD